MGAGCVFGDAGAAALVTIREYLRQNEVVAKMEVRAPRAFGTTSLVKTSPRSCVWQGMSKELTDSQVCLKVLFCPTHWLPPAALR